MLQRFVLFVGGGDNIRMTMADADRDDSAERIEIAPAGFVPDVLHLPLHDHERLLVVEKNSRIQELLAQLEHFIRRRSGIFLRLMVEWWEFRCLHDGNFSGH